MNSILSERLAAAAGLWSIVALGLWICRRCSPLHMLVLSLVATGLVGSFFPLLSAIVPPATWRNIGYLSPPVVLGVQIDYAAYAAGLVIAALLGTHTGWLGVARSPRRSTSAWIRHRDLACAASLVLCGAALYAAYVERVGLASLLNRYDYAEKYLRSTGLGPLAFGLSMMIAGCLWAEASPLSRRTRFAFLALAIGIAAWSIGFISVRTNFAILVIGYLYVACRRRDLELRRLHPALVAALIAAYAVLESFSLFRDVYRGDLRDAVALMRQHGESAVASVVGGSELSHPFITAAEVAQTREPGELAGASYAQSPLVLAPLALYPERPLTLSERFARSYYADFAARGGGTAFSLVAEAWLNFGPILGALLIGALVGWTLLWLERRCALRPDGLAARSAPYMLFIVLVQHRNEFASLLKQVLLIAGAILGLWLVADALWSMRVRWSVRAAKAEPARSP